MEGIVYNIFVYKDKKLQTFSKPVFTDQQKEAYIRGAARAAVKATGADLAYCKDQALYFQGTYNDETGKYDLLGDPEKCFDLEDYLANGKGN